jgi:hypothetical protein
MPEPEATATRRPPSAATSDVLPAAPPAHEAPAPTHLSFIQRLQQRYVPLEERLARLRQQSRQGARTATWLSSISSVFMLLIALAASVVVYLAWQALTGKLTAHGASLPNGVGTVLEVEAVGIPLMLTIYAVRTVIQLATAPRLFAHYYRLAMGYFAQRGVALVYADEDFRRLLEEARQRHIGSLLFFQPPEHQRSFERQLEYNACYGLPLRWAGQLRPAQGRLEYVWGQATYKIQHLFRVPLAAWLAATASGAVIPAYLAGSIVRSIGSPAQHGLPPHFLTLMMLMPFSVLLLMLPLAFAFRYAPRYIISRARLVALLDFLSGQPRVDITDEPAPEEPRGWWARQLAPWQCRERAPE